MTVDSLGSAPSQRLVSSDGVMLSRPLVGGTQHAVSSGHYLATQAAFLVLEAGGNAVDAGVAAGLVLSVVQSDVVNFAGVAPMLFYSAEKAEVHSIAGLGGWPRALPPDLFMRHHAGIIPQGLLRTVVPAAPDAWITALSRFGTMTFSAVAAEAIRLARFGFVMYPMMANIITAFEREYSRWPSNAKIYLPGGRPPVCGQLFVQEDLARTMQYMADQERVAQGDRLIGLEAARAAFYKGDIAATILKYHRENDGLLRAEDLESYRSPVEVPIEASFSGFRLCTPKPWCQGPALIEIMRIADELGIDGHSHNSANYIHLLVEAIKAAFDDRHEFFGDPNYVDVPIDELLSISHAQKRARAISPHKASERSGISGQPSQALDTSYVCVVDRYGNAFSATPSDVSMDSPVIPGTGICPSSRGSQSWGDPLLPSGIAPGKRPRLTPSPAMTLFNDGRVMPFGTPGGDVQLQAMAQVLLNITMFGMNAQEAVDAPRFASYDFPDSFEPHTRLPGRVTLEADIGTSALEKLREMGHDAIAWPVRTWRAGGVCLIDFDPNTGIRVAGADPRRPSYALAC